MLLSRRYKHLGRLKEIANTLARHGFGFIIDQLGLSHLVRPWVAKEGEKAEKLSLAQGLRQVLEELGPTAIKLGQILSTRADLLPKEMISELAKLQDKVPPFPYTQVQAQIEKELGQPVEKIFAHFHQEPLAAASIGQVHRARLISGEEVVVKIQRPGIEEIIGIDLNIIRDLARLAQRHTQWGQMYNFVEMAEEFARALKEEMDYYAEGRNGEIFRENFAGSEEVYFPKVYWDYTTSKILTLEYLSGVKLSDRQGLLAKNYDLHQLASRVTQAFLRMVLFHGFFHADPHPGNICVLPGQVVGFMDFGMVGRITEERKVQFVKLVQGLISRNSAKVLAAILEMGVVAGEVDHKALSWEIQRLRDRYYNLPLKKIRLGKAVEEILELAFKYRIQVPSEFTLLGRALITLEGVVQELDPEINIMTLAEPIGQEILRQKFSLQSLGQRFLGRAEEYGEILLATPKRLDQILSKLEEDKLTVRLEHRHFERALKRADRIINRLSFAVVLLAFSIIMTGLIIASALEGTAGGQPFWRLPVLEVGFLVASLMFFWLIFAILKSGRF